MSTLWKKIIINRAINLRVIGFLLYLCFVVFTFIVLDIALLCNSLKWYNTIYLLHCLVYIIGILSDKQQQ